MLCTFLHHVLHAQLFFIFGCCKLDMTFLPWLLVSSIVYENPTHVIVGIFELHNTIGATMAN
jgi:hypothetical protein